MRAFEITQRSAATMSFYYGPLAQLVEQGTFNPLVVGSSPTGPIAGKRFTRVMMFLCKEVCDADVVDDDAVLSFDIAPAAAPDRLRFRQVAENAGHKTSATAVASADGATAAPHRVPRGFVVEVRK